MQEAIKQYQELMNSVIKLYMNTAQSYMLLVRDAQKMSEEQFQEYVNEQYALIREWSRKILARPSNLS
jgi:alpha-D-ribose 1-methylphosphonate 5-triphosphate diphosphatase PhnM